MSTCTVDVSQEKSKVGLGEVCSSTLYSLNEITAEDIYIIYFVNNVAVC